MIPASSGGRGGGATRAPYVKKGMKPFRPNARQTLKTYYEVPVDIIEDHAHLMGWAEQAAGHASRAVG